MIDPPLEDTLEHVGSKFALITMVTKRSRQINSGAPKLVVSNSNKPVTLALKEIAEKKILLKNPEDSEKTGESEVDS
jgi:DNA-directed RNA polymerase subunit omega